MSNVSPNRRVDNGLEHEFNDVHEDDVHEVVDEEAGIIEDHAVRPLEVDDGDWVESDPALLPVEDDDERR